MGLRKDPNGAKPAIAQVTPAAAIAGGEFYIEGKGFARKDRPRVTIGEVTAPVIVGSESLTVSATERSRLSGLCAICPEHDRKAKRGGEYGQWITG